MMDRSPVLAAALVLALSSAACGAERPLSPKRKELLEAVEAWHTLQRRAVRGIQDDREMDRLKHSLRRARERVSTLKHEILKEEQRPDDYYQDDPYQTHKKDPETGKPF